MAINHDHAVDMLLMLGECRNRAAAAAKFYKLKFPDRDPHPTSKTFRALELRLRKTGSVQPEKRVKRRVRPSSEGLNEERILSILERNPQASLRQIAREIGSNHCTVWRVVQKQRVHPLVAKLREELRVQDGPQRVAFCQWMNTQIAAYPEFLSIIMFTDESHFDSVGIANDRNTDSPSEGSSPKEQWGFNVWCGILGDHIIGPYFFEGLLTGKLYLKFLKQELFTLLKNVPSTTCQIMWFQQDGAPYHCPKPVRDYLNEIFPKRRMGPGSEVPWPPFSPDLSPLDFYLWGYIKREVYQTPPDSEEDLKGRITAACRAVTPERLAEVRQDIVRRFNTCIQEEGGPVEDLTHD